MYITESLIRKAIQNANEVLKSVVPNYNEPCIRNITITNSKSYFATVQKSKDLRGTYNLRVSRMFNLIPDESVAQNRLEECMIHTLPRCWNHGQYFHMYAHRVYRKYPDYKITTSTKGSDYGIVIKDEKKPKYVSTCKCCKNKNNWYRKPKYDIHLYCCSKCGGDLTLEQVV